MNSWKTAAFVTALFLAGFAAAAQAQVANNNQAEVLLQEAQHRALVDGDLERAIELCKKILAEHNGNRAAAAKALMQMGQCYEKLGRAEARKAYERVVQEFADQHDLVAEARMRLAVMESDNGKPEVTVRRVWSIKDPDEKPDPDFGGEPSPDGRYLCFTNWSEGNLAVRDLTTGEFRDLTDEGTWSGPEKYADDSTWSPDGKQIAYDWWNAGHWELRIISLDGSKPRILYRSERKEGKLDVHDWSQDGKYILTRFYEKAGSDEPVFRIALVSVADGLVRVLRSVKGMHRWHRHGMSLSPDGAYVVYTRKVKEDKEAGDIFLLGTEDGAEEVPLVEHPADEYGPLWAPDGKTVVFVSDRSGEYDAWLVQVVDGKPLGKPQLVKKDVGGIIPMGFTQEGSLYYGAEGGSSDVYTASVDPTTGKPLTPPTKAILQFEGHNGSPVWSPDGKSLAYFSRRSSPGSANRRIVLVIRSEETGEERELYPEAEMKNRMMGGGINWSPDGRSLLCRKTLDLIDVQTGDVTRLVPFDPEKAMIVDAEWSPDGKVIYYIRTSAVEQDPTTLVAHDLETGKEKKLLEGRVSWPGLAVSPDGRKLVFSGGRAIRIMPIEGGEPRTLHRLPRRQQKDGNRTLFVGKCPPVWTTDGNYVLFGTQRPNVLWRVSAEGGEAQKLLAMEGQLKNITVHPDGRRIAFTGLLSMEEVWAMESFLPESTASE